MPPVMAQKQLHDPPPLGLFATNLMEQSIKEYKISTDAPAAVTQPAKYRIGRIRYSGYRYL
jgi:hypothetical protein